MLGVGRSRSRCNQLRMMTSMNTRLGRMARRRSLVDSYHERHPKVHEFTGMLTTEGNANLVKIDDCVEVAAEGHVIANGPVARHINPCVQLGDERGDISDCDPLGTTIDHGHFGHDQTSRSIEPDGGHGLGDSDHACLNQNRCHADRSMSAHGQAPGHLDVENAPVAVWSGWWC